VPAGGARELLPTYAIVPIDTGTEQTLFHKCPIGIKLRPMALVILASTDVDGDANHPRHDAGIELASIEAEVLIIAQEALAEACTPPMIP
jgi:hypothetical protein